MKQCVRCNVWYPNAEDTCDICGDNLEAQEYSSEDADDGLFIDRATYHGQKKAPDPMNGGIRK